MKGLRFSAVMITGILCGLAGAYMATALQAGFGKEMTAGRGYIALAALIFAKWQPIQAMYACLLFGFFQALALRPDVVEAVVRVKVDALDARYILTVLVLAGFVGKAIPARAGGGSPTSGNAENSNKIVFHLCPNIPRGECETPRSVSQRRSRCPMPKRLPT